MTNEVLNTMKTRRSCRCYLDKMPEPEALNAVLEAGTWAPTGMGRQSPVIVCIQNKADRDTLSKMNAAVMGGKATRSMVRPALPLCWWIKPSPPVWRTAAW